MKKKKEKKLEEVSSSLSNRPKENNTTETLEPVELEDLMSPVYPEFTEEEIARKQKAGKIYTIENKNINNNENKGENKMENMNINTLDDAINEIEILLGENEELEGIIAESDVKLADMEDIINEHNRIIVEKTTEIDDLGQRLSNAHAKISDLEKLISEKDEIIANLNATIQSWNNNKTNDSVVVDNTDILLSKLDSILNAVNDSKLEILDSLKKPAIKSASETREAAEKILTENNDKQLIGESTEKNKMGKPYFQIFKMPKGFGNVNSPILLATRTKETGAYFSGEMKTIANSKNFTYAKEFGVVGFIVDTDNEQQMKTYNEFVTKFATLNIQEDTKKDAQEVAPKEDVKIIVKENFVEISPTEVPVKEVPKKDTKKDTKDESNKRKSQLDKLKSINKNF